jgi:hypothetical protein
LGSRVRASLARVRGFQDARTRLTSWEIWASWLRRSCSRPGNWVPRGWRHGDSKAKGGGRMRSRRETRTIELEQSQKRGRGIAAAWTRARAREVEGSHAGVRKLERGRRRDRSQRDQRDPVQPRHARARTTVVARRNRVAPPRPSRLPPCTRDRSLGRVFLPDPPDP